MVDVDGMIPFTLKQKIGGQLRTYAPLSSAEQIIMPDGSNLAEEQPSEELVTIKHGLGGYPQVLVLVCGYGSGTGSAGEGPAGGSDLVECPRRVVYHSPDALTVYVPSVIAALGVPQLIKVDEFEYLVTFTSEATDSLYIKLLLNMGSADIASEVPAQLFLRQQRGE